MNPTLTDIIRDGLWHNNPGLVQLLGLCPLLAISATMVNAIGLGIATTLTLLLSNVLVSLIRDHARPEIRIPVYVLIIASIVTAIELAMNAWFHGLYLILGIFIPLIVTNCIIIARAEGFASRHGFGVSLFDGLMMGMGFGLVLVALGGMREVIGFGTLFDGADQLFGPIAIDWGVRVLPEQMTFLLALMPPGAFIGLALLVAFKQAVDQRSSRRARVAKAARPVDPAAEAAG